MKNSKAIASNFWVESTLNSYSIILYSDSKLLALLLILVTCMTPKIGIIGLAFIIIFNAFLRLLGYHQETIRSGLLGFNALLVGLALAYGFELNTYFIGLFAIAQCLSLWIIIWCKNYFDRYQLPFFTIPFVLVVNMIMLAANTYEVFAINMDYVFLENSLVHWQKDTWYQWVHCLDHLNWFPTHFQIFLYTLSTVFFQKSILAGLLILAGLFFTSRLVTLYALVGFYSALFFLTVMGGDIENLNFFYSGANFIFMAISLGCYFYIANRYSLLFVFVLSPVVLFLMITLNKVLFAFQMNAMSLPFSVITSMTLYILHHRHQQNYLIPANIHLNSPEKALYEHEQFIQRKTASPHYKMSLPFWGEWTVSQGYDGGITHLDEWGKALDFVITDEEGKTYAQLGETTDKFYCFNKPVVAPADGYVYNIINFVEDNGVNVVNVEQNWGNSIIINHLNGLYSQISHLKKDSFKVEIGAYVKQGDLLAYCGNSGRSPEPHIHFQVQHTAHLGAAPVALPLSYYIHWNNQFPELAIHEVPKQDDKISPVISHSLLLEAFSFLPNQTLQIADVRADREYKFPIHTNAYNQLYFHCAETNSVLYFKQDGTLFMMDYFEGDTASPLFLFYQSCYAILLGYYPDLRLDFTMPIYRFMPKWWLYINDLLAPIKNLSTVRFYSKPKLIDNGLDPDFILLETGFDRVIGNQPFSSCQFDVKIRKNAGIEITDKKTNKTYLLACVPSFSA